MSSGFETNAIFFELGFLDKNSVALGRQLAELLPVLWLKAGAKGKCPQLDDEHDKMMILPENQFAILINERYFNEFNAALSKTSCIKTIYFVTDSDAGYREMIAHYPDMSTYQLYRDYLDNFRIKIGR